MPIFKRTSKKSAAKPKRSGDRHTEPQLAIRVPADELDAWRDAAADAKVTLKDWIRRALNDRSR